MMEKGYTIPTMEEPVVPRDLPEFFGPKEKEKEIKKHVEELCMDLRFVNRALPYKKFKMEGLKQLRQMIKKGDYMTSIDLKDDYLHVPIAEESQRLLQFKFNNRFYRFRAMPFGLSTAPRIFTKILRSVVQVCRARGIRLLV